MSRGKHSVTPVIVEVRPDNAGSKSKSKSPQTPPSPPSPSKAVRFAPTTSESRQLTTTEAWSLYHFETHARDCHACYDPLEVYLQGHQLCPNGHALAQDVALHVYYQAGEIYGMKKDDHKPVRVEIPASYGQLRLLLKAMDRAVKSNSKPVISYDRTYPVAARRVPEEHRREHEDERREVVIEPHSSQRDRHARVSQKSRAKPSGYKTVVVEDNVQPRPAPAVQPVSEREPRAREPERRPSTYEKDLQRQQKDKGYRVVIREPAGERRRRERRGSEFYD